MTRLLLASLVFAMLARNAHAQKVAPPITRDRDHDGVPDLRDRCLLTGFGVRVDQAGCAVAGADSAVPLRPLTATPTQPAPMSTERFLQGRVDGRLFAEQASTSGRFVGGLGAGMLLGLIGTGIAYAVADNDGITTPDEALLRGAGDQGYLTGFEEGYAQRLRARRKSAALGGGLLGTGVIVLIIVSAAGGN